MDTSQKVGSKFWWNWLHWLDQDPDYLEMKTTQKYSMDFGVQLQYITRFMRLNVERIQILMCLYATTVEVLE